MKLHAFLCLGFCTLLLKAHAADPKSPLPDPDVPQTFNASIAKSLLDSSPFTRSLNLSDSIVLTGIAYVEGKPVATLLNKATKESYIVSEVPNAQGWKLAETNASTQLQRTQVKIMVNTEVVTVRFSDEQLTPGKKGSLPGGGSSNGGGPPLGPDGQPRIKSSSLLGEGGRERYMSLSNESRDKYRGIIRDNFESMPNATIEERSAFAKKVFEKIEAADKTSK